MATLTTPTPFPILGTSVTEQLATRLRATTTAEVRFTPGDRALYASDLSHYRQIPLGVIIPRTLDDVIAAVAACRDLNVPLFGRGAGTSLSGQTTNAAVVIDFSKYLNQIEDLNPRKRYAWIQPGLINDGLRSAAERHNLTFAPDPATHEYCTVGGMIGNNSCGPHSVLGGKTSENIEELDILLYDGTRLSVGPTTERELKAIIKAGGRKGEIYAQLRDLRDTYADLIRKKYPNIPRRVSGYNLDYLLPENGFHVARALVGSEGTCVTVLRAKTKLIHSPQHRVLLLLAYPTVFQAADQSPRLQALGPIAIEGLNKKVIENARLAGKHMPGLKLFPNAETADTWLLIEFGADTREDAIAQAKKAMNWVDKHDPDQIGLHLLEDPKDQKSAMEVRELGLGVSRVPGKTPNTWGGWDDAAVDPKKLGPYLREFYALLDKFNYFVVLYGHFGQGCVHTHIDWDLRTPAGVQHYRNFVTEAAHLVVKYGGSLSGEHGDGQARAELLPIMCGPELIEAFRKFKRIWDPAGKMNPGKIVDPYPLDSNLRTGPDYKPLALPTIFQFPDDHGSMAEATERCFGVGKCRKLDGGTMCPSFHATREEKHTTRGRARLLFEMLRGDSIPDTWRNEEVKEALDLCLACKGCKGDCPASVDIATYKAEFLAHYYEGRLRPNYAYSMGLIDKWAALASHFPSLANLATQTPILRSLAKKLAGVTQHRDMPTFPNQSFKQWLASSEAPTTKDPSRPERSSSNLSSRPKRSEVERPAFFSTSTPSNIRGTVILWADTFNNHFTPHTAQSALAVLEDAGFRVQVPRAHLCCGRPLYDFGMLDQAKAYLRKILATLADDIAQGTPIVVLEPSCASVFKDELTNLFPHEEAAQRLSKQVILFPDFLEEVGYKPRSLTHLTTKAVIHGHCHHKALWSMSPEHRLLESAGLTPEVLDSGCCGLAGSFGYEAGHHDISMQIGNQVLLPRLRAATPDTLLIADGFSCRQQIAHGTSRQALHTAEVLALALGPNSAPTRPRPSRRRPIETGHAQPEASSPLLPLAAAGLVGVGIYFLARNRNQHNAASKPGAAEEHDSSQQT